MKNKDLLNEAKNIKDNKTKKRIIIIVLGIIFFLVPFVQFSHLFFSDKVFVSGDGLQFFTFTLYGSHSIFNGDLFMWNRFLANGVPYYPPNFVYPLSILLSFLPEKMFVFSFYGAHLAIGGVFFYLYLKEVECSEVVAICTSIIYVLSTHLGGLRKSHMVIIATIIYLPVILYFIENYIKTHKFKWLVYSSIFMAIQFFMGFWQSSLYSNIIVFIYLISIEVRNKKISIKWIKDISGWLTLYIGLIMVQLIPTFQIISEYSKSGSSNVSLDFFKSYSIHPFKALMMIFPNLFGENIYQSLGPMLSSEFDIELFLGVALFSTMIFGISKYYKEDRFKLIIAILVGTFIFAANAHIPGLSPILYKIPIIGGFRVPSRILFIFIFFTYVLCAMTLSKIRSKNDIKEYVKFNKFFFIILISIVVILSLAAITAVFNIVPEGERIEFIIRYYSMVKLVFMPAIIAIGAIFFIMSLILTLKDNAKIFKSISLVSLMVILITSVTILETNKYQSTSVSADIEKLKVSELDVQIRNDLGNKKIWEADTIPDKYIESIIFANSQMTKHYMGINSYMPFNNPRLSKLFTNKAILNPQINLSGLFINFIDSKNNLYMQNDLLSMLGIKYILDPSNIINKDGSILKRGTLETKIYNNKQIEIPGSSELFVFSDNIKLESNTWYRFDLSIDTNVIPELFYLDFQGGPSYDNAEQNKSVLIKKGFNKYSGYIMSGDVSVAEFPTQLRIITNAISKIVVSDLNITKIETTEEKGVYIPYKTKENISIYENLNAKDILFSPEEVQSIDNVEEIYDNVYNFSLDKISYIENTKNYVCSDTEINVLSFDNNQITAKLKSEGHSFVNFSQNYFPGWKATIDGKEVPVKLVNGLIQGVEIPQGEFVLQFKFVPVVFYISAGISFLTLLISLYLIIKKK